MKVTSRKVLEIHLSRLPFYLRDEALAAVYDAVSSWWDATKHTLDGDTALPIYPDPFIRLTDTGLLTWEEHSTQLADFPEDAFVCDFEGLNKHYNGWLVDALLQEDMYKAVSAEFNEETTVLTVVYQDGSVNTQDLWILAPKDAWMIREPIPNEVREWISYIYDQHGVESELVPSDVSFTVALRLYMLPLFTGVKFEMRDGDPVLVFRNGDWMEITSAVKQLDEFEETMGEDFND